MEIPPLLLLEVVVVKGASTLPEMVRVCMYV
jgi:hypothetical protein